jgi:general transcription factor 3C polypeptide 3 (transcription factor C subunit 4)
MMWLDLIPAQHTLGTTLGSRSLDLPVPTDYAGVPVSEWLTLFLDYAVALAVKGNREESYRVCQAARDSVAFKTVDFVFRINVAWCGTWARAESAL